MRFVQRLFASIAIRIEDGRSRLVKGKIPESTVREVERICREAEVLKGEIWIDKIERITFSCEIPPRIHQRLRNSVLEAFRA